jgi:hypothetical protein
MVKSGVIHIKIKKQLEKDPKKDIAKFAVLIFIVAAAGLMFARNLVYETVPVTEKDSKQLNNINCTMYIDKTQYPQNQELDIFIKIGNTGKKPVSVEFAGKNSCETVILKETSLRMAYTNKEVWRNYSTFDNTPGDNKRILEPGQSRIITLSWNQQNFRKKQVSPGYYIIATNMKLNDEEVRLRIKCIIEKAEKSR